MSNQINLVQNDTAPDITVTLYDATNNAPIDLSNAGTVAVMRYKMDNSTNVLTIQGAKVYGGADGVVAFVWPSGALSQVGSAEGEIEITFSDGKIHTVPNKLLFYTRAEL